MHVTKGNGTSFEFPDLTARGKTVCDAIDQDGLASGSDLTLERIRGLERGLS